MAYPNTNYYNPYQPNIQAPMDRLAQLQQPYQMPMQQQDNRINWVQGEAAARAYIVAPGASLLLMDSDENLFYIKTVDNYGMPQPLRTFRYTEITNTHSEQQKEFKIEEPNKYVTRQEYDDLKGKYDDILKRLDAIPTETPKKQTRKAVTENE